MGYIDDALVSGAVVYKRRKKKNSRLKWWATAACLCLVVGLAIPVLNNSGGGLFGNWYAAIYEPHREDFSPEIGDAVKEHFNYNEELKKAYILRTDDWFLSDSLLDFSQALTTDTIYVVPGDQQGNTDGMTYSFYKATEHGKPEWMGSAYPPADASAPFGFAGLTYELIDNTLVGLEYEDYIITYAQRLHAVFVWVRCKSEDVIVTYPTRPDLLGLEAGGIYTLDAVKSALNEAYGR